jgi:hypothetical protein
MANLRLTQSNSHTPTSVRFPETFAGLMAVGLTERQARDAANRWPPGAARDAIQATRSAQNPAAALAARVKQPPPAAPDSQRGAVDGPIGSAGSVGRPGTYRPLRLSLSERRAATDALDRLMQADPRAYWAFHRRAWEAILPSFKDRHSPVLHHPRILNDFGPSIQLALDWGVIALDDGQSEKTQASG